MSSKRTTDAAPRDLVLIGVDGGASGLRAARVACQGDGLFELAGEVHTLDCDRTSGARAWIDGAAQLVARVGGSAPVLLGMGMPGVKTADGRGIAAANHGPVEARFLELLEARLMELGVSLVERVARLDDDGLLGCAGECHARGGALVALVGDAYYLGGGTGLAEALVVGGAPLALEAAPRTLERAYRIEDAGRTFEERLGVGGLNRSYSARGGEFARIEEGLARGESLASGLIAELGRDLERLVEQREHALATRFERVVVGQRLAQILSARNARPHFERALPKDRVVLLSSLHASAVLGAAALAHRRWHAA